MFQPYLDNPNNWGVPASDPEELLEQALGPSAGAGLSLTIHAIGDRANRDVLNVLGGSAATRSGPRRRERQTTGPPYCAIASNMSNASIPSISRGWRAWT